MEPGDPTGIPDGENTEDRVREWTRPERRLPGAERGWIAIAAAEDWA